MTSINTIGLRIAGITFGIIVIGFGLWKGTVLLFSHEAIAPSPAPTELAQAPLSDVAFKPAPPQTIQQLSPLSPEVQKELTTLAKEEAQNLGAQTKKYVSALPDDATPEQVINPQTIEQFIAQNKGALLPELPAGTIKTSTATGADAIKKYLDSISPTQNTAIQVITGNAITTAFQKQESGEDVFALTPVRTSIEKNFSLFKNITAPKEAIALHTKLLQSSQALLTNISLLQTIKQDTVGGLIGLRNIADLDTVFADISKEISTLEKKYNLK